MIYVLMLVGFYLLVKGGDFLVDGASDLAKRFNISDIIIGLTIVSLGTSMPEFIVSIIASIQEKSELIMGNVLGSNIANVLLILAVTAIYKKLPVQRNTVLSEIPYSIATILLVGFLANSQLFPSEEAALGLGRIDGVIISIFFLIFFGYIFIITKETNTRSIDAVSDPQFTTKKSVLYIVIGVIFLALGGSWVVEGAIELALLLGMSETFVSLTVVALGTSLPELVTSLAAARKGSTDVAVGNVIGSNIFNALWILGFSGMISPVHFDKSLNFDVMVVLMSLAFVIVMMIISRKSEIKRWHGIVLLIGYIIYNIIIFQRG